MIDDLDHLAASYQQMTGGAITMVKIGKVDAADRIEVLDWCVMHEVILIEVQADGTETVLYRPVNLP